MTTAELDILTIGEIAERVGAPTWAVRRTLDAMKIAKRIGPSMRIIATDDLPIVAEELARRGYVRAGHPERVQREAMAC
jgi:hypothetical protein